MDSLGHTSSKKANDPSFTDISFSSYLKHCGGGGGGEEESEINVFDAKKYFSEGTDWKELSSRSVFPAVDIYGQNEDGISALSEISRFSPVSSVQAGGGFCRSAKASTTPTAASSEASWNSQTGLLTHPPGSLSIKNIAVSGCKERRRGSKWLFCPSKCPCSGKKSIQVQEAVTPRHVHPQRAVLEEGNPNLSLKLQVCPGEPGQRLLRRSLPGEGDLATAGGFSFPIFKPTTHAAAAPVDDVKMTIKTSALGDQLQLKQQQDPLRVFQPPVSRKSIEEIQSTPPPRRGGNCGFPGSPAPRPTAAAAVDDDAASDASSDLFEIESFSTQGASYPMYRRRDSLEDDPPFNARRFSAAINIYGGRRSVDEPATPSVAATENYPPSEVSIDWSVTTAEGFDRASTTSFSIRGLEMGEHARGGGGDRRGTAEKCKSGGGLLSCRHEKAVSVGPNPVRLGIGPPALISHVSGRPPKPNKPASHPARVSLAFAA
ncbi:unnamed protein product [Cuscuta campestris]|uniref:Protein PHYTOCHROME KINASE SUBSTRATE 4 n=2 Tax=Cuscuta sect. Cleistogrammica TaxID=1824901 RepID=A0A484LCB2_9ASTE|nr:hypothetical protein DM860_005217 [Cuscuta australis]VFQ74010.1 unnamed protein product [Cuscuta campestris]